MKYVKMRATDLEYVSLVVPNYERADGTYFVMHFKKSGRCKGGIIGVNGSRMTKAEAHKQRARFIRYHAKLAKERFNRSVRRRKSRLP